MAIWKEKQDKRVRSSKQTASHFSASTAPFCYPSHTHTHERRDKHPVASLSLIITCTVSEAERHLLTHGERERESMRTDLTFYRGRKRNQERRNKTQLLTRTSGKIHWEKRDKKQINKNTENPQPPRSHETHIWKLQASQKHSLPQNTGINLTKHLYIIHKIRVYLEAYIRTGNIYTYFCIVPLFSWQFNIFPLHVVKCESHKMYYIFLYK